MDSTGYTKTIRRILPTPLVYVLTYQFLFLVALELTYPFFRTPQARVHHRAFFRKVLPSLAVQDENDGTTSQERYSTLPLTVYVFHFIPGAIWAVLSFLQLVKRPLPVGAGASTAPNHRLRGQAQLLAACSIAITSMLMTTIHHQHVTFAWRPAFFTASNTSMTTSMSELLKVWEWRPLPLFKILTNSDAALATLAPWVLFTAWKTYTTARAMRKKGAKGEDQFGGRTGRKKQLTQVHAVWALRHALAGYGVGLMRLFYIGYGFYLQFAGTAETPLDTEWKKRVFGAMQWTGWVCMVGWGELMLRRVGWVDTWGAPIA
ncbi:hypothetical protein HK102_008865 [Quaeritorhiza haematococci]|nr:hypothetical protein HK102_008865 [Quaeritorhiza haematococci]